MQGALIAFIAVQLQLFKAAVSVVSKESKDSQR